MSNPEMLVAFRCGGGDVRINSSAWYFTCKREVMDVMDESQLDYEGASYLHVSTPFCH